MIEKVGEALLIALFIAIVVDRAIKEDLIREIVRDASPHILGGLLPPELREQVSSLLQVDLVRSNWEIIYNIERHGVDFVRLVSQSRYTIENRSRRRKRFGLSYEIEQSWSRSAGEAEITLFQIGDVSVRAQDVAEHGHRSWIARQSVELGPGEARMVRAESVEYFPIEYSSTFVSTHPVLSTQVHVYYPKDDLKVELTVSNDNDETGAAALSVAKTQLVNGSEWTIPFPLLPGHCFEVRWGQDGPISHLPPAVAALRRDRLRPGESPVGSK